MSNAAESDQEKSLVRRFKWSVRLAKVKRLLAAVPIADLLATVVALAAIVTIGASIVGGTVKPETLHYFWISEGVASVLFLVLVPLLLSKTWLEYQRRKYDPSLVWMFQKEFDALEDKRKEAAVVCFDFIRWGGDEKDEIKRWSEMRQVDRVKVEPVLDCFEDIGFYLAGDQFSDEVAHHNFFHWIRGWYSILKPYIAYYQSVRGGKAAYIHLKDLYQRMAEIERGYPKPILVLTTDEAKLDFLREEGGMGDLEVSGGLSINSGATVDVVLTIRALNMGETPASIGRAAILLAKSSAPMPLGITKEKAEEYRAILDSTEISPMQDGVIDLAPHGGQHAWEMVMPKPLDFATHTRGGDQMGKGYVMLTSGRKMFFEFALLDDAAWEHVSKLRQIVRG